MNKTDLVAAVAADTQLSKDKAAVAVEAVIKHIQSALLDGNEVRIPGFGNFKVMDRKATTARNPRTGETVPVAAKDVPKVSVGATFKTAVKG